MGRPRRPALPRRIATLPKHLAEKIFTSKAALEGERKQVTVLFADLKGSMELLADRDPEEARKILDPVQPGCRQRQVCKSRLARAEARPGREAPRERAVSRFAKC